MSVGLRNYALVTLAYWGFTITDGALRMLVLLAFHSMGYSALEVAFLFLFYEVFGVITTLLGGWISSRSGLKLTLYGGVALQIFALGMLALLPGDWNRAAIVTYVMAAQALSGIAKDLTKTSAKSAVKLLVPSGTDSTLFRWVAVLTGSKNALKGVGFFVGSLLLALVGFQSALWIMAAELFLILLTSMGLPSNLGRTKAKIKFRQLFSKSPAINVLSAARFFLFGARDIWFVVGLPVFLSQLGWTFEQVGGFLACWVIGYGMVQSLAPVLLRRWGRSPDGRMLQSWTLGLSGVPLLIVLALQAGRPAGPTLILGLLIFGVIFAVNSAVHSYLILAYSPQDQVTTSVGFYYMANAGGRLIGTILSGLLFQWTGLTGCLLGSCAFLFLAGILSFKLPQNAQNGQLAA